MTNREIVVDLVKQNNYRYAAELGVWRGQLSRMLAPHVDFLLLVDPMNSWRNDFHLSDGSRYTCTMGEEPKSQVELDRMYDEVLDEISKLTRVIYVRSSSIRAVREVGDNSLDFVFVDSVHVYQYCKEEIGLWLPKIRKGGAIAGDDYVPEHRAVARAVDEVFGEKPRQTVWWEYV